MADTVHALAPHALPAFITAPGETDTLFVIATVIVLVSVAGAGALFFRLHSLPERLAHGAKKLQFEIVAVLGLISLFTHIHLFWVAGLLLALIDIPDWGAPLRRIAQAAETIAGTKPAEGAEPNRPGDPEPSSRKDA